jgi:hypothetical protein
MSAKYAYEYGQRWLSGTPRRDIGYVVDKLHVSRSDSEVTEIVESRIPKDNPKFTVAIRRQCIKYALLQHTKNRDLYYHIAKGI